MTTIITFAGQVPRMRADVRIMLANGRTPRLVASTRSDERGLYLVNSEVSPSVLQALSARPATLVFYADSASFRSPGVYFNVQQ